MRGDVGKDLGMRQLHPAVSVVERLERVFHGGEKDGSLAMTRATLIVRALADDGMLPGAEVIKGMPCLGEVLAEARTSEPALTLLLGGDFGAGKKLLFDKVILPALRAAGVPFERAPRVDCGVFVGPITAELMNALQRRSGC